MPRRKQQHPKCGLIHCLNRQKNGDTVVLVVTAETFVDVFSSVGFVQHLLTAAEQQNGACTSVQTPDRRLLKRLAITSTVGVEAKIKPHLDRSIGSLPRLD